ncbi:MAG: prepilin peptidase [Deltaproteobacteria bacterium]|nr:MAG: prepilin peptidase [Deltaproteobacteria bacterium]
MAWHEIALFVGIGLSVGSFLNVLIYRLPAGKSVISPSSQCACGVKIKPYHNIPVLSWLLLRGKSACCGQKISVQYPLIELAGGLIFTAVLFKLSYSLDALVMGFVFSFLLALSLIDFRHLVAYDSLNLATLSIAVFHDANMLQNITNAFILAGALTLLRFYVSYFLKKEAMGEGDIIIAATMGAALGVTNAFLAIFVGAVFALIGIITMQVFKKQDEVPFIPFLSLGMFVVFIFDELFVRFFAW